MVRGGIDDGGDGGRGFKAIGNVKREGILTGPKGIGTGVYVKARDRLCTTRNTARETLNQHVRLTLLALFYLYYI